MKLKAGGRLLRIFRRRWEDEERGRELADYLERETEENIARGMRPEEARRVAHVKLGNARRIREEIYEMNGIGFLETLWQDLCFGLRMLRKSPGFTAVAVLTLALGIGANTAIFSVVESVLLQPLPFTAPEQLVHIDSTQDGLPVGGPSPMDMLDFSRSNRTLQSMAVFDTWRKNISFTDSSAQPEQVIVGLVPAAFFKVLDIEPILGQLFTNEAGDLRKDYVAVISEGLWKNRYSGNKAIIGRTIRINDEPYTIVAVIPDAIPRWMEGAIVDGTAIQIWTPIIFADASGDQWTETGRRGRGWYSLGRLKPSVTLEQAQADLASIASNLAVAHPVDQGIGVKLEDLSETRVRNLRPMLFLLAGAVSLILLIACVNLANLLLARNSVRERELAMRAALGAGRGRLVRQLLAETLLLSFIGGGVGLLLALAGVRSLASIHPQNLPQLSSLGIDWRVLSFTVLISLLTSLLFGLGPALAGSRLNLVESLKLGSRSGTPGSSAQRMRNALVVTEMAMSLMLLVGASLLVQSILRLERQDLGIRPDNLLTGHFYLPPARYPNKGAITRFADQFADRVRAIPGVMDASITTIWPPTYNWGQWFEIAGRTAARERDIPTAQFALSDDHFLKTMGIPLIRGRDFNESDTATSPPVALINLALQRKYFPNQYPVGQRIHIGPPAFLNIAPGNLTMDSADVTIIGVTSDFRNNGLALPPEPQIIVLYSQNPLVNYGFKDIVVRAASNPYPLVPEITRQLHSMDAEMPFAQVRTIDEIVQQRGGRQRFAATLLGLFATVGLILAAVGIYGVVSFLVAQRRRELAIRVAVGASAQNVLWLVLKGGLNMAAIGAAIGLVGAFATQKLIGGLLFGISPVDPLTLAGSAVFMAAIALIACWMPAWRAARVDPCIALRAE